MNRSVLIALLALLSCAPAQAAGGAGMFGQGQTHLMIEAGNGYAFNNGYLILGAGVSYYVLDGLGVGLAFENWSGGTPGIRKITPSAQYVFYQGSSIKPYIGGFYRHATITGLPSLNSVGARAGVYFASGSHAAIGAGIVHESYLNCQTAIYATCSESYPEISAVFSF